LEELSLNQRLRQWSRRYKWPFIGLMWVIAIVLGYIGFAKYFTSTGQTRSVWDTLYVTMQLFTLESGAVPGPIGWELNIARFLAPLMAVFTAIQVVASIFREQIQLLRMRFLKGHIVICGLGRKGFLLSRAFRRRGEKVVVLEQDAENDLLIHCQQDGIMVLLGNATDMTLLRQAGVNRAKYVISVCGNDSTNAEVAAQVHRLVGRRKGKALSCLVHIYNLQLYNLVREREMAMGEMDAFRLELFNVFESGSRLLLREYPPFSIASDARGLNPHILIVGVGRLGESIVVNSARTWWERHTEGAGRLRITLIDNQAEIKKELLSLRYPQLEKVCDLVAEQIDIKGPDFERADFLFNKQRGPNINAAYVCLDDDSNALSAALTLRQRLGSTEIPIVVRTAHESGLATLLQKRKLTHDSFINLRPFGLLDRTCTPELISECTYDILAQAVHQNYVDNERKKGSTPETNPSMVPWENLPESLKESNLNQVEHIRVKLEAIGCDIAVTNEWNVPTFRFSPDEIELMAKMEHERFVTERKKQGFTNAPTKDLTKKKSPTLVSWHELPDSEKEKDRDAVRQLPEILAKARFRIYRFREKHE
jgi:voltage-gated potassium channel Kch